MELNRTFRPYLHTTDFSLLVFWNLAGGFVWIVVLGGGIVWLRNFFYPKGSLISRKSQYFCVQSGQFRPGTV